MNTSRQRWLVPSDCESKRSLMGVHSRFFRNLSKPPSIVAFILQESYDVFPLPARTRTVFKRGADMKFPGGLNIQQMMKQAQTMQEQMQKEMAALRVEASSGGGVVTVEMQGNHEILSLKIDPEAVKDGDVEMLQDMILAAINEANRKVDEAMKGKIGGMLPPGLGGLLG